MSTSKSKSTPNSASERGTPGGDTKDEEWQTSRARYDRHEDITAESDKDATDVDDSTPSWQTGTQSEKAAEEAERTETTCSRKIVDEGPESEEIVEEYDDFSRSS